MNHCPCSMQSLPCPSRLLIAKEGTEITRGRFVNISCLLKQLPDSALLPSPPPASRASDLAARCGKSQLRDICRALQMLSCFSSPATVLLMQENTGVRQRCLFCSQRGSSLRDPRLSREFGRR